MVVIRTMLVSLMSLSGLFWDKNAVMSPRWEEEHPTLELLPRMSISPAHPSTRRQDVVSGWSLLSQGPDDSSGKGYFHAWGAKAGCALG